MDEMIVTATNMVSRLAVTAILLLSIKRLILFSIFFYLYIHFRIRLLSIRIEDEMYYYSYIDQLTTFMNKKSRSTTIRKSYLRKRSRNHMSNLSTCDAMALSTGKLSACDGGSFLF